MGQLELAIAAQAAAAQLLARLTRIEEILERQLELSESNRNNFKGIGTRAGGGSTVDLVPHAVTGANYNRRGFSFQNLGPAGNISLGIGTTQPQIGTGITLTPGESWDGRISGAMFPGRIHMVAAQAGTAYSWLEA